MEQNIFEELQSKKQKLIELANKAAEFGWIPEAEVGNGSTKNVISLDEIKRKLEKDTLTIGVIGQMKCGKSTFLNSSIKVFISPPSTLVVVAVVCSFFFFFCIFSSFFFFIFFFFYIFFC